MRTAANYNRPDAPRAAETTDRQGSALIIVLMVLAVLTVMVAHLTASSELAAREAHVVTSRSDLRYAAESAAERAFWLFLADRRQFRSRALSVLQPLDMVDQERWLADGSAHDLGNDEYKVEVRLFDANRGLDASGPHPEQQLRAFLLQEGMAFDEMEIISRFIDVLLDYVDSGDGALTRLNGKEQAEYEAEGYPDMPRNGPLAMRDELIWIDGVEDVMAMLGQEVSASDFMKTVRVIPPHGRSFPSSGKPSFFSSSPLLIQRLAGLSAEEIEQLDQARQDWHENRGNFFTYLEPGLTGRLQQHFSFAESTVVTVVATASSPDKLIQRQLRLTRHVSQFAQPRAATRVVENWQKVIF